MLLNYIKLLIISIILLMPLGIKAQVKKCDFDSLTFDVNMHRKNDTIGNIILSPNANHYLTNLYNVVFTNVRANNIEFSLKNANVCYYKYDTILVIQPTKKEWEISYLLKGQETIKKYHSYHEADQNIIILIDNREQFSSKKLVNYNCTDSISFELEDIFENKWYPLENFDFTITNIFITLVRGKKVIKQTQLRNSKSFYINDVLKKGKPNDRLLLDFNLVWNMRQVDSCGGFQKYTLGYKK